MALPDPGLQVFDALFWSDEAALAGHYEAVSRQNLAKLIKALNRAYERGDLRTIVIVGPVLARTDALRPKDANNIATCLVRAGRFAQALEVLAHPCVRDTEDQGRFSLLARALGGVGRLDDALAAADRSLSLRPDCPKTLPFRELLTVAIAVRDQAAPPAPVEALRLAGLFETQGLGPAAESVLERTLRSGPVDGDAEAAAWFDLAELALERLDPASVRDVLLANAGRFGDEARRQALLLVCAALLGRPEAPPEQPGEGRAMSLARAFAMEAAGDLEGAIAVLAGMAERNHKDREPRRALARCVGSQVIEIVRPQLVASGRRRIVNLLPFYNEFTMLQMRLHEMAGWVDEFVIVEAAKTFTGLDKPLNFQARKAEFAAFGDKITHVVVDRFPPYIDTAWSRDYFQRDMAVQGISGRFGPDDLVLLTDADEIIDRRAIDGFEGDFAGLEMSMFKYFLNYRPTLANRKRTLIKSSVWKAAYLQRFGSSYLRFDMAGDKARRNVITAAGWHFTSIMDSAAVSQKMRNTAHTEHVLKDAGAHAASQYDDLLAQIRNGTCEAGWERCEVDETYPAFIRERTDELAHMLL